ncbi:MAG: YfiR family protein [Bacteroidetes bacterium]|nr:MAG: YfiR family protein [Bacteroidota bacterium]
MKKIFCLIAIIFGINFSIFSQQLDKKLVSLYMLNFTKHIEWPNMNSQQFVIGVIGSPNDIVELTKMANARKVNGKQIIIKLVSQNNLQEIKQSQFLLISEEKSALLNQMVELLKDSPVIIVTEKKGLIKKGASISMFLDEDDDFKTKFQINKLKIEQNGLKVSSELVALSSK